jgi:hypothetical protein
LSEPTEKPSRVACPECKGEDSIGVYENVEIAYNIGAVKEGVVEAHYAHLNHVGFTFFVCLECTHTWKVPEWLKFRLKGKIEA